MSDWASGYVTEIGYTHGYYHELCPSRLSLAVFNRGIEARTEKPLRYLELGFGQGLSFNIHAAACPGEFWGFDFNPSHVANALELAEASGSGARIFDSSFAEFAARSDLPEFDIIALHGVWSWVSDENRSVIVDLARRKLAVGGLLYVSYNCTPGWAAAAPLRDLLVLYAETAISEAEGVIGKVDGAIAFAQKVANSGALYFKANPSAAAQLKTIQTQDRAYLAHEYLDRHWQLMPFSQVATRLREAKLEFAASANLVDHVDEANVSIEGGQLLAGLRHPILRESVRDHLVNQRFRQDIFIKGARAMPPAVQAERYGERVFVLTTPAEHVSLKLPGPRGEIALKEEVYQPLIASLAENSYAPKSVMQLLTHAAWRGQSLAALTEALIVLTGSGQLAPAQGPDAIKLATPRCNRLNAYLCQRAHYAKDVGFLASPVIGGGVPVNRFRQLFLQARGAGQAQAPEWASFAWGVLKSQGQRIVKDGKTLDSDNENIAELTAQADEFAAKRIPVLKALGIAE